MANMRNVSIGIPRLFQGNTEYEAQVARIVTDSAVTHHSVEDTGWIAELDG